jgi:hypothetical protein
MLEIKAGAMRRDALRTAYPATPVVPAMQSWAREMRRNHGALKRLYSARNDRWCFGHGVVSYWRGIWSRPGEKRGISTYVGALQLLNGEERWGADSETP